MGAEKGVSGSFMPRNLQKIYDKAVKLARDNRLDEARVLCDKLTTDAQHVPVFWLLQASVLEHLGRIGEAEICLDTATRYLPDAPQVFFALGVLAQKLGNLSKAESCFREAVKLNRDYVEAIHELAGIYKLTDRPREALELYLKCLRLRPDYPAALYNLGMLYDELGRPDDALPAFDRCLVLSPKSPLAMSGKAMALEKLGKCEEARLALSGCIDTLHSIPVAIAYALVARNFDEMLQPAIEYVSEAINKSAPSDDELSLMYSSLGRLYEKIHDYDSAFSCYRKGNSYKKVKFDMTGHKDRINRIKNVFDKKSLLSRSTVTGKKFIFIIGMPRSGTTLIEKILDSHPGCFGAGELTFISDLANNPHTYIPGQGVYPEIIGQLNESSCNVLAMQYMDLVRKYYGDADVVVDKMPANFLYLGMISVMFPDAAVIHSMRNPLDICLSCYCMNFGDRLAYTNNFSQLLEYYKSYADLMRFWREHLDIPIMDVRYEDLVSNQEGVSKEILEFCGLDWDESCLKYFESNRLSRTASYDQVRRPVYQSSVNRWKMYERYIGELYEGLEPFLEEYCYDG